MMTDRARRALTLARAHEAGDMNAVLKIQSRQAIGEQPIVDCICGAPIPLRFLYRCLYCGVYFCLTCAEKHFGKTREQYGQERIDGARAIAGRDDDVIWTLPKEPASANRTPTPDQKIGAGKSPAPLSSKPRSAVKT